MFQRTKSSPRDTDRDTPPPMRGHRPVLTSQQRLEEIEQMRKRVNEYADFMSGASTLQGTSAEAKEAAIIAFHERMVALEKQLGQISEGLRLG